MYQSNKAQSMRMAFGKLGALPGNPNAQHKIFDCAKVIIALKDRSKINSRTGCFPKATYYSF